MPVTMIRVKRVGNSIFEDLKKIGFVQVNVVSFCIEGAMALVHRDFGTKKSTDLVVSNEKDAESLIDVLKKHGMYLSHHMAENMASANLISSEHHNCDVVKK